MLLLLVLFPPEGALSISGYKSEGRYRVGGCHFNLNEDERVTKAAPSLSKRQAQVAKPSFAAGVAGFMRHIKAINKRGLTQKESDP